MNQRAHGFTIVELLIVIVVIGVLAAISVTVYVNVQGSARAAAVRTDLVGAKKQLEQFNVEKGRYPSSAADMSEVGLRIGSTSNYEVRPSSYNFYYCADIVNNEFSIGSRVADSKGTSLYITSTGGVMTHPSAISSTRTCTVLGLTGQDEAHGAYSNFGLSTTGAPSAWLSTGS